MIKDSSAPDGEVIDRPTVLGCLNLVRTGDLNVSDAIDSLGYFGIKTVEDLVQLIALEEVDESGYLTAEPDDVDDGGMMELLQGLGIQMPFDEELLGLLGVIIPDPTVVDYRPADFETETGDMENEQDIADCEDAMERMPELVELDSTDIDPGAPPMLSTLDSA